jgi:hypothetical protein
MLNICSGIKERHMVNSREPHFLVELLVIILPSAQTAGTDEIFFDVKEIKTGLSVALRMDPCVLRKLIFLFD